MISSAFFSSMKYWSCCQRKTSEFDNFLNQEGCTEGKHLWVKKDVSIAQMITSEINKRR